MPGEPPKAATDLAQRISAAIGLDGRTDGQLLVQFLDQRDEAAFAELVRRHGAMVLTTCHRITGNSHDADDAFQAAFVVLVRQARKLTERATIGNWLYGVAYNVALKAKAVAAHRRKKEIGAAKRNENEWTRDPDNIAEEIHREISRLPQKFREPLVLIALEGRQRREVASVLGIPEGTLSSRIDTAKKLLADRLVRRALIAGAAGLFSDRRILATQIESAVRAATIATGFIRGELPHAVRLLSRRRISAMVVSKWLSAVAAVTLATVIGYAAAQSDSVKEEVDPPKTGADAIENGVYLLQFEGDGKKVQFTDGYEGVLGKRITESIGVGGKLQSVSNDNTRFKFTVDKLGPLTKDVTEVQTALIVDGYAFHLGRPENLTSEGLASTWTNVESAEAAEMLAAKYKIEPELRKHPGYRYEVRWLPQKTLYAAGETVTLRMELKNTGATPFEFGFGGKQRGPRNNQFRFVAQATRGMGKSLPDVGDPTNFGGLIVNQMLKPGETFTADVDLTKWFSFTEADTYRVTAVFEMPIIDPKSGNLFGPVIWDDLVCGDCLVHILKKVK